MGNIRCVNSMVECCTTDAMVVSSNLSRTQGLCRGVVYALIANQIIEVQILLNPYNIRFVEVFFQAYKLKHISDDIKEKKELNFFMLIFFFSIIICKRLIRIYSAVCLPLHRRGKTVCLVTPEKKILFFFSGVDYYTRDV